MVTLAIRVLIRTLWKFFTSGIIRDMYDVNDPVLRNLLLLSIITLPLKAICLWKAAQANQKVWFITFLFLNTIGLLEITYLFYFLKSKNEPKSK